MTRSSGLSSVLRSNLKPWAKIVATLDIHALPMKYMTKMAPMVTAAAGSSTDLATCPSSRALRSFLAVASSVFSALLFSAMCHALFKSVQPRCELGKNLATTAIESERQCLAGPKSECQIPQRSWRGSPLKKCSSWEQLAWQHPNRC